LGDIRTPTTDETTDSRDTADDTTTGGLLLLLLLLPPGGRGSSLDDLSWGALLGELGEFVGLLFAGPRRVRREHERDVALVGRVLALEDARLRRGDSDKRLAEGTR